MKKSAVLTLALLISVGSVAAKKVLDHDSFDSWNKLYAGPLSNNGQWATYAANPQEGDATLVFYNTRTGKRIEISRGYNPSFSADSKWGVALIKPFFQDTRKGKIDKKKDFDLPQDSLAIIDLANGSVEKIPNVISYKVGKEGGEWLAYQSCDTLYIKPAALKDKKTGKPLVVRGFSKTGKEKVVKWVDNYTFSKNGKRLALTTKPQEKDSLASKSVGVVNLPDTSYVVLDYSKPFYGAPVFDEAGDRVAYTLSEDSLETGTRKARLFMANLAETMPKAEEIEIRRFGGEGPTLRQPHASDPEVQEKLLAQAKEEMERRERNILYLNQYSVPKFSHDGKRLYIGVGRQIAPDDTTLVDFELPTLDIWRWDAPFTPPQEKKLVEKIRKNTYPVCIDLSAPDKQTLLISDDLQDVALSDRGDGDWALVFDPSENIVSWQWDYTAPKKISVKNVLTGETKEIGTAPREEGELSPEGKYVAWYDARDYYVYDIASGTTANVSSKLPYPIWNETQDIPLERESYGVLGWSEGDKSFLLYDKYDIWALDPKGIKEPVNITKGEGRKNNLRFRYVKTDPEERFVTPGQLLLFTVFDYGDKRQGLATMKYAESGAAPAVKTLEEMEFLRIKKAKDADVYSFQKDNFSVSPDLWVSVGTDFAKAKRVSDINPQMKEYNWGTAQLVKWYAYNGVETEGVLYLPEDLDPTKKYPMMVVFYETNSEELYHHYDMEPSWSWVNYPFYVSRGYVVFVPDVHYAPGIPGESAYNYICSGVEDLCKKYSFIDKDKIGIDGQSWGGYQTAFLVTRTNMFACAGSGAPVSNMTSAFGGIRWGTGDSRQAQYEQGQSRIGRNLWENPQLYIANSPIFYADRVETPLLIMHNDDDGAVPWYQGIELFMALRRLNKPVWMLTYNGEAHNLKERRNRKDITIRLQQFFDHYLKDAPMPEWMINGIPAIRKGQEFGY